MGALAIPYSGSCGRFLRCSSVNPKIRLYDQQWRKLTQERWEGVELSCVFGAKGGYFPSPKQIITIEISNGIPIWNYVNDDNLKTVLYNETKVTDKN